MERKTRTVSTSYKNMDWNLIHEMIKTLPESKQEFEKLVMDVGNDRETMLFLLDKTIGATNDSRMVQAMELLLCHGGKNVLHQNPEFKKNLMKKALIHENQFVVIYEDWTAAEAYLNVHRLLEEMET